MTGSLAGFVRSRLAAILLIGAGIAAVLTLSQKPFANSAFEFGHISDYQGVVSIDPYPVLEVNGERLLLMGPGKTDATVEVEARSGDGARLRGTAIHRGLLRAVEVVRGSVAAARLEPRSGAGISSHGRHTLRGEIVDSKCYLGVMKPGRYKPHRACAVNCIRGGAPPVLVVEDRNDRIGFFLLVDEEGRAVNQRVLDLVAEPVEITGEVVRRDNLLYLEADPQTYRRLEPGS